MTAAKRKSGFVNPFPVLKQIRSFDAEAQAQAQAAEDSATAAPGAQKLDPKTIRPTLWANRHHTSFVSPEFAELKAEIESAGGNVQPIKVRPVAVPGEDGARYEIVFGHRRHRACLDLGLPVLAVVATLDDQALFAEMDRENRGRANLSAWEQGMMYRRALDLGLFQSARQLAAAVNMDHSQLAKALRIAALPDEVVRAFPSPAAIQYRWVKELDEALQQNREAVLAVASALPSSGVEAVEAFSRMVAAGCGTVPHKSAQQGRGTVPHPPRRIDLGRGRHVEVREKSGRITLEMDAALLPLGGWEALEKALRKITASTK